MTPTTDRAVRTNLQDLFHLRNVHVPCQFLHVNIATATLATVFIVIVISFHPSLRSFAPDLPQSSPEFNERVFVEHAVERFPCLRRSRELPPIKFLFKFEYIKAQFCDRE